MTRQTEATRRINNPMRAYTDELGCQLYDQTDGYIRHRLFACLSLPLLEAAIYGQFDVQLCDLVGRALR